MLNGQYLELNYLEGTAYTNYVNFEGVGIQINGGGRITR
jgi:hypothetical protein